MSSNSLYTVISGSYRKYLSEMYFLKKQLESLGVVVLSPVGTSAVNPEEEFIFLDSDPITDRRMLQDSIFAKIRTSSFLVLANFEGYIGNAALLEVGYALSLGLQILTVEEVLDPNIGVYTRLLCDVFKNFKSLNHKEKLRCHI